MKKLHMIVLGALLPAVSFGQMKMQTIRLDTLHTLFLSEIKAVVSDEKGKLIVQDVFSRPNSTEEPAIDLFKGDEILMCNTRKMATIDDLKAIYRNSKEGETIKLGLNRDGSMRIASFIRSAPEAGGVMMVVQGDGKDAQAEKMTSQSRMVKIDDVNKIRPLPGSGLLIEVKQDALQVMEILHDVPGLTHVHKDDQLLAINETAVSTLAQMIKAYEAIPANDTVTLKLKRAADIFTATFTKEAVSQTTIIRK